MKQLVYLCGLLIGLLSCKHNDVAPDTYLKTLSLGLEPQKDGISLKWTPVFIFEEGMYGGPSPAMPAQYEVYISESDEKSLRKVAVIDGNTHEYVLRGQPEEKTIYAQVKAIHPKLATSESNIATTNTGQLGTTSLLFGNNTPGIIYGSWAGSTLLYSAWSDTWTMYSADGKLRTLKSQGTQPVLSPDGRYIAFLGARSNNTSYSTQLVLEETGTETLRVLDTQQAIFTAEWSHDGKWLAYTTYGDLWKVSVADGKRTLINQQQWDSDQDQIDWSPDDKSIIWSREIKSPGVNRSVVNLLAFPVSGGDAKTLLSSTWRDSQPAYSPDGKQLAFMSNRSGYPAIWVMNTQTGKLQQLTGSSEHFYYINRLDWMSNSELTYSARLNSSVDTSLRKVTLP